MPRVGSHYLQERIYQHTGLFIEKSHFLQTNKMITIARDPVEFLTSELSMMHHFDTQNTILNNITDQARLTPWLKEYAGHFTKLNDMDIIDDFYIIVDYKTLIDFPLETSKAIAKKMNIDIVTENYEIGKIVEREPGHILSSKNVKDYSLIKECVEKTDLSDVYDIYNAMLSKSIEI